MAMMTAVMMGVMMSVGAGEPSQPCDGFRSRSGDVDWIACAMDRKGLTGPKYSVPDRYSSSLPNACDPQANFASYHATANRYADPDMRSSVDRSHYIRVFSGVSTEPRPMSLCP